MLDWDLGVYLRSERGYFQFLTCSCYCHLILATLSDGVSLQSHYSGTHQFFAAWEESADFYREYGSFPMISYWFSVE